MTLEIRRKFISGLFLFIFSSKMIISAAPLFFNFSDSEQIRAVILQLEIENNAKETDVSKDKAGKAFYVSNIPPFFVSAPLFHFFLLIPLEKHSDIESYYPSVPTPPPNA
jgi:hypothetical protein